MTTEKIVGGRNLKWHGWPPLRFQVDGWRRRATIREFFFFHGIFIVVTMLIIPSFSADFMDMNPWLIIFYSIFIPIYTFSLWNGHYTVMNTVWEIYFVFRKKVDYLSFITGILEKGEIPFTMVDKNKNIRSEAKCSGSGSFMDRLYDWHKGMDPDIIVGNIGLELVITNPVSHYYSKQMYAGIIIMPLTRKSKPMILKIAQMITDEYQERFQIDFPEDPIHFMKELA